MPLDSEKERLELERTFSSQVRTELDRINRDLEIARTNGKATLEVYREFPSYHVYYRVIAALREADLSVQQFPLSIQDTSACRPRFVIKIPSK